MRSDGIPTVFPGEIRVNLVTGDSVITERNRRYAERAENYSVICSENPLSFHKIDIYVLPVSFSPTAEFSRLQQWLPVFAYGSARDLRAAYAAGCSDFIKDPWGPKSYTCAR